MAVMSAYEVADFDQLMDEVPDGTVIVWKWDSDGTPTMSAGLVSVEMVAPPGHTADDGPIASDLLRRGDVWISTGGQVVAPSEAYLTFPCVALGTLGQLTSTMTALPLIELPDPPELTTDFSFGGGTYPRDKALECAAIYWQGMTVTAGKREDATQVLATAAKFADWLDGAPPAAEQHRWTGPARDLARRINSVLTAMHQQYGSWDDQSVTARDVVDAIDRAVTEFMG